MASEQEIERLIVRLVGDNSEYERMIRQSVGLGRQFQAEVDKTTEAERQSEIVRNRGVAVTRSVMTAAERYADEIADLNFLLDTNAITQETADRATARAAATFARSGSAASVFGDNLQRVGLLISGIGAMISGVFGAIAIQGAQAAGQFEQTTISFETMLGSADETVQLMKDLTVFAAKTPFEMPEILQATRGLVQFGERGEELMDTLNLLGNAASATATPFGFLALVFNQIRGVGKLLTQDFRQLSTRGVISLKDIAKHFGVTDAAAQKMLSAGKVSFADVKDIFRNLSKEGGRFANMMERQSKSLLGLQSTLSDNIGITKRQIGEVFAPMLKLIVKVLVKVTDGFTEWSDVTRGVVGVIIALGFATGFVITAFGAWLLAVSPMVNAYQALTVMLGTTSIAQTVHVIATRAVALAMTIWRGAVAIVAAPYRILISLLMGGTAWMSLQAAATWVATVAMNAFNASAAFFAGAVGTILIPILAAVAAVMAIRIVGGAESANEAFDKMIESGDRAIAMQNRMTQAAKAWVAEGDTSEEKVRRLNKTVENHSRVLEGAKKDLAAAEERAKTAGGAWNWLGAKLGGVSTAAAIAAEEVDQARERVEQAEKAVKELSDQLFELEDKATEEELEAISKAVTDMTASFNEAAKAGGFERQAMRSGRSAKFLAAEAQLLEFELRGAVQAEIDAAREALRLAEADEKVTEETKKFYEAQRTAVKETLAYEQALKNVGLELDKQEESLAAVVAAKKAAFEAGGDQAAVRLAGEQAKEEITLMQKLADQARKTAQAQAFLHAKAGGATDKEAEKAAKNALDLVNQQLAAGGELHTRHRAIVDEELKGKRALEDQNRAIDQQIKMQEEAAKKAKRERDQALKEAEDLVKSFMSPQEKFEEGIKRLLELRELFPSTISDDVFGKALKKLEEDLLSAEGKVKDLQNAFRPSDAVRKGSEEFHNILAGVGAFAKAQEEAAKVGQRAQAVIAHQAEVDAVVAAINNDNTDPFGDELGPGPPAQPGVGVAEQTTPAPSDNDLAWQGAVVGELRRIAIGVEDAEGVEFEVGAGIA